MASAHRALCRMPISLSTHRLQRRCPYADLDDLAYVKPGVLYDWYMQDAYDEPSEYPCACEMPGVPRIPLTLDVMSER
jgi:hypothetical protein